MKYYVYHISDSTQLNTGYIGVTKNPQKRWKDHTKSPYRIGAHIRSHGWSFDANFRILLVSDKETCYNIEKMLRPSAIGLNETSGGIGGEIEGISERWKIERRGKGNPNFGKTRTAETKARMSEGIKRYYKSDKYTADKKVYHSKVLSKQGTEMIRGTRWWTNGIEDVRSVEPPSSEWKMGRSKFNYPTDRYTTEDRAKLDTKTKPVTINGIYYFSIAEAVRQTGMCKQTIRKILKGERCDV